MEQPKERFRKKFDHLFQDYREERKRIYVSVAPEALRETVTFLFKDLHARFITASGFDDQKTLEILYHFSLDSTGEVVSIRVNLDRAKPEVDSLVPVFRGAFWIEREIWEMLGINFREHPRLEKFLLSEDWPEASYPQRIPAERSNKKIEKKEG